MALCNNCQHVMICYIMLISALQDTGLFQRKLIQFGLIQFAGTVIKISTKLLHLMSLFWVSDRYQYHQLCRPDWAQEFGKEAH